MPTPLGHFSSPLDNMIAAASRLAAIPMEGDSIAAVETRRARDLLQTVVVQQQAYSYSRDRIHSTPHPSPSYSRHMDEPEVSSSARRRNAQDVVDNGRARREAALGHHQPALGLPSVPGECRVLFRLSVMCVCPKISRVHVKCRITPLIYPLKHG